jgi:superfamily II DNA or RNA helicase/HKD family nuclease
VAFAGYHPQASDFSRKRVAMQSPESREIARSNRTDSQYTSGGEAVMWQSLPQGLYEQLLDEELQARIADAPELRVILRQIDDESAPHAYAQFIARLLQQSLRQVEHAKRIPLLNRLIELLAAQDGLDYLQRRKLLANEKSVLTEISPGHKGLPRPVTPLNSSALLTGKGIDPPLEHELRTEMASADRVDLLISFIKWSGLRLLIPAFEQLRDRQVPVRILSTSYMGASDPAALEWLAGQPNIEVRLSYDTAGTRLHAKAYHFWRDSGFSTAYIGSANLSHAAMTQGLEWTVKVTAQDMPHILDRFGAEFATYWESHEFESFGEADFQRFRAAIGRYRQPQATTPRFFAEITPRPFQQRILEALQAARQNDNCRNLVVAATGTGKTVIAALDYRRLSISEGERPTLLFVVHRKEILQQALECFRSVLRDQNFGELLVDGLQPQGWQHVFASVQSLNSLRPWIDLGQRHFTHVVVDEAHHGVAASYRPLFDHLQPQRLLGLTATPERMDGSSILDDFAGEMTAEIRLPEALAEKLLCPFHYFGVSDNVDLSEEKFWRNGRYASDVLEQVFTGDDIRALQRVDLILKALRRYQPEIDEVCGVGFCAGVKHAHFMADHFNRAGIAAAVVVGSTPGDERDQHLQALRRGELRFLFTVDVLSEGVDIPEINLVLFLRPTESLTVFLQQLGRGLRHAPGKDCLTVLDFVGQTHRRYRIDTRFAALLMRQRQRMDREIENDFPNLPPGCNIQLERVARERVLAKVKTVLSDLNHFIPETLQTWDRENDRPLTFGHFIQATGLSAVEVLRRRSWSEWKAMAMQQPLPTDPDMKQLRKALPRIALRSDSALLDELACAAPEADKDSPNAIAMHYLRWGKTGPALGIDCIAESVARWQRNPTIVADAAEIAAWRRRHPVLPTRAIDLPFTSFLQLHAAYGSAEIKAALGLATLTSAGPAGQGVIHAAELKCYIHLITFHKDDRVFSPTTRYRDYPISATQLHWESQSTISQSSATGQNYLHFKERGYTILFFARIERQIDDETAPFIYLGPAKALLSAAGNRPIRMVWELDYPIPAILLEESMPVT